MTTSELWLEPMIFSLPKPIETCMQNLGLLSAVSQIQGFLPLSHLTSMTLSTNVFVYLDGTFFANGQAYVALSTVKTFTQLHLLSFDPTKAIKVSQCVRGLYGMECNRSSEVTPSNMLQTLLLPLLLLPHRPRLS